jgi:hypothetical protein
MGCDSLVGSFFAGGLLAFFSGGEVAGAVDWAIKAVGDKRKAAKATRAGWEGIDQNVLVTKALRL